MPRIENLHATVAGKATLAYVLSGRPGYEMAGGSVRLRANPVRAEPVEAHAFPTGADREKEGPSTGSWRTEEEWADLLGKARRRVNVSSGDPTIDREVCEIGKACGLVKPRKRDLIETCIATRKERFPRSYVAPGTQASVG